MQHSQCDKHVVKMILESAQILYTAHHEFGNHDVPYKVRTGITLALSGPESAADIDGYGHFKALSEEYTKLW